MAIFATNLPLWFRGGVRDAGGDRAAPDPGHEHVGQGPVLGRLVPLPRGRG